MIYCTLMKIGIFRFAQKFHVKITTEVLFARAGKELLHRLHLWVGRVTSKGLVTLWRLAFPKCITLLLIQELNHN